MTIFTNSRTSRAVTSAQHLGFVALLAISYLLFKPDNLAFASKFFPSLTERVMRSLETEANATLRTQLRTLSPYGQSKLSRLKDSKEETVLTYALNSGNEEAAEMLLAAGIAPEQVNRKGEYPLDIAMAKNMQKAATAIINAGAKIDAHPKMQAEFMNFIFRNKLQVFIDMIPPLEHSQQLNLVDHEGNMPILSAYLGGHHQLAKDMLLRDPSHCASNAKKQSLLSAALENHDVDFLGTLIGEMKCSLDEEYYFPSLPGYTALRPLEFAILTHDTVLAELTLDAPSLRLNYRSKLDGNTYVNLAASQGQAHVINLLIRKNADYSMPNAAGQTPLISACKGGHERAAILLLSLNPNLEFCDKSGLDALAHAITANSHRIVEVLLEKGNDRVKDGDYLPLACLNQSQQLAEMLIWAGANPDVRIPVQGKLTGLKTEENVTGLFLALKHRDLGLISFLAPHSDLSQLHDGQSYLSLVSSLGDIEVAKILIKSGHHIDFGNEKMQTPLMTAIRCGHTKQAELLIVKGADPSIVSEFGESAQSLALLTGNEHISRLLSYHEAKKRGDFDVIIASMTSISNTIDLGQMINLLDTSYLEYRSYLIQDQLRKILASFYDHELLELFREYLLTRVTGCKHCLNLIEERALDLQLNDEELLANQKDLQNLESSDSSETKKDEVSAAIPSHAPKASSSHHDSNVRFPSRGFRPGYSASGNRI